MIRVLLVDDMLAVKALLRVYLMEFQFEFLEAKNGLEGLGLARAKVPALIITDIQMPVMGGLEMLDEIRRDPLLARIPVIVLSSDEQQTANLRLLGPALTFVALKPIEPLPLKTAVRQALNL